MADRKNGIARQLYSITTKRKHIMIRIAHAFTRLAQTTDGKTVLNYLRQKISGRILSPQASNQELWYLEGQRALIATMERLIQNGKQP
jgi:hypothetical protein